jgi:hypothetical protein
LRWIHEASNVLLPKCIIRADLGHVAPRHRLRLDIRREWSVVQGMRNAPKKAAQPVSPEAIAAEIAGFSALPLKDLKAAWSAEFRREAPKGMWRDLLLRTLAWRLQEKAFGGHDRATLKLLEEYGHRKPGDQRCRRLKTGTVLIRDFEGTRHTVSIVPGGFIWQEKTYASLSAIARIITGTNWNGPRFFGLREGRGQKDIRRQEIAA